MLVILLNNNYQANQQVLLAQVRLLPLQLPPLPLRVLQEAVGLFLQEGQRRAGPPAQALQEDPGALQEQEPYYTKIVKQRVLRIICELVMWRHILISALSKIKCMINIAPPYLTSLSLTTANTHGNLCYQL